MTKKEKVKQIILSGPARTKARNIALAYRRRHKEHVSRSTVLAALSELRDEGFVRRGWGRGRNSRWDIAGVPNLNRGESDV
jgi:hypothetical protein